MGKTFTEFWKRPIAAFLAFAMMFSMCSAGIPIQQAHAEEELVTVDGRIISETAMAKIEAGGRWADSFAFTADVLTEIFGTTIATIDSDPTKTIDLAKDINSFSIEEDSVLAEIDDVIDTGVAIPITLQGNGKKIAFRIMGCNLSISTDDPCNNYRPYEVDGVQTSDLVAKYQGREGTLINRDGVLSIGLGQHDSVDTVNARFDTSLTGIYKTPPTEAPDLGKSFNLVVQNNTYLLSNIPHVENIEYSALDTTPALLIVAAGARNVAKTAYVRDVTDTANPVIIPATITYTTASGADYVAGTNTTEKVTASLDAAPYGYKFAPGEDGIAEFGYWDETAYIDVVLVQHSTNFSVVDKYNSSVTLPQAVLTLEQKVDGNWTRHSDLVDNQLTTAQIAAIRAAASTSNYEFRVVNSVAQPGYDVDTSVVALDARYDNSPRKIFQEAARYTVEITNVATDGTPMEGATYTVGYGNYFYKMLTLDEAGKALTPVFNADGSTNVIVQQYTTASGYVTGDTSMYVLKVTDPWPLDTETNSFRLSHVDADELYVAPDYNHHINISMVDDANQPVSDIRLGIYTDVNCTIPAKDENGNNITDIQLTSDESGNITIPEVNTGTYYIKLERSTNGYTDTLFTPATDNNTPIFTAYVLNDYNPTNLTIGIRRQFGDMVLTVLNETDAPVEGAVYELTLKHAEPSSYAGVSLADNTVVGRYTTNADGFVHITTMNEGPLAGHKPVNGTYELALVSAPVGYTSSTQAPFDIDLSWTEHEGFIHVDLQDGLIYAAYNANCTVVDKYDNTVRLNQAVLMLQQKVNGTWQDVGALSGGHFTAAHIQAIRNAATTANYEFRIINSAAQPGYTVDDSEYLFDARYDANLSKQFQEVSQHIVHISNIADNGVAMTGVKYVLTYGAHTEDLILDGEGNATSSVFAHNGATSFTLTRVSDVEDYTPDAANQTRIFDLKDMVYDVNADAFAATFVDQDTYTPPDYNHYITIHVQDETHEPVAGVQVGLFADANYTNRAIAENGAPIVNLISDADGNIYVPEVNAGTYYVKLEKSVKGYSDTVFAPGSDETPVIFTVTVVDDDNTAEVTVGIMRQTADITLTVVDENGTPVVGAVFELKANALDPNNYAGVVVDNNVIVGSYTTDSNGVIHIDRMADGPLNGHNLINGSYNLSFVSAPAGFIAAEWNSDISLAWVESASTVYATAELTIPHIEYNTTFSVVSAADATVLTDAVLSLEQKVGSEWQHVGDLTGHQLTADLIDAIRAASNTENYEFRVINRAAEPGYVIDTTEVRIDARLNNTIAHTFIETSKHIIHISNIADNDTPMEGAKYTLTYGDFTEELILDENGTASSSIFMFAGNTSLTLTRDNETKYYIVDEATKTRTLALADMTYDANADVFVYTFADQDAFAPDYNHYLDIVIKDDNDVPVANVELGLYTDSTCQTPAKTELGEDITIAELTSNAAGEIHIPEVPAGTYYVKLNKSVKGYSDVLFAPATDVNTDIFSVIVIDDDDAATLDVGIRRQRGEITLTVIDNTNQPVEGAVYELELVDVDPATYAGANVELGVVGTYTTDANGVIKITHMNAGDLDGHKLINGSYKLTFVSAPVTYKPSDVEIFNFDLMWQEHASVVTGTARDVLRLYKAYTLYINIEDAIKPVSELYTMYAEHNDSVFQNAYDNSLLTHSAYLIKGKEINMTITHLDEIEVIIDGELVKIAPDTLLLTHTVDSLNMSFDKFSYLPEGATEPIAIDIPMGTYRISMDDSGTGYEWVQDGNFVDAYDDINNTITTTLKEKVIYTGVTLAKTDANYNTPISNITFALVPVDLLIAHGFDVTAANITNKDITEFMEAKGLNPRFIVKTDDNGAADFGQIPYATYWLVEWHDEQSAKYEMTQPEAVVAHGSAVTINVANISKSSYIRIEHTDKNSNAPIANAKFEIIEDTVPQGALITNANGFALSQKEYIDGNFIIKNIAAGAGYVIAANVEIAAVDGVWTMTTANGSVDLARTWDSNLNKWVVIVPVEAEKNNIAIHANFNGQALDGATFTVYDENHNVIEVIENTNGTADIEGLAPGKYYVAQSTVDGFASVPEQELIITEDRADYLVVFNNQQTYVSVKTYEGIGGWELKGVVVEMYKGDVLVATFNDTHKFHLGIPVGDYVLKTVTMPAGYQATSDIAITVRDTAEQQIFINNLIDEDKTNPDGTPVLEDNRTYGALSIYKFDTVSETPLQGVEFSLRYAETITIDGTQIAAGTHIETLITDAQGKATTTAKLPIAIYTENGLIPVKYALVETKLPVGQYVAGEASIDLQNITFEYKDAQTPVVTLEEIVIENDRPEIRVVASSDPETRLFDENGSVDGFDFVTALKNGDKITYTITVSNLGTATGYDIDIKDIIPAEFVVQNHATGSFSQDGNEIRWHIPELQAGESVDLILVVTVDSDYSQFVQNDIEWFMPDTPYGIDEEIPEDADWTKTPSFEYQIIQFKGMNNQRELIVSAYDTITFNYTFKSVAELDDFCIEDIIPEGLTLVDGSVKVNGEETENFEYDGKTRKLTFFEPEEWANTMTFSFTVKVDHINNGEEFEWNNSASATFLANAYTNETMTLMTDDTTILADALMTVEYEADVMTYVGEPEDCDGATVLQKGDKVRHTVYIYNDGISSLKRIALKSFIPENATAIRVAINNEDVFNSDDSSFGWYIRKLAPGESLELSYDTVVKEQKAGLLTNYVTYDLLDTLPSLKGNDVILPEFKTTARDTDASVYQAIEFHKIAEVTGKPEATEKVAIGDTIIYTMSVESADFVEGIEITDKLPAGVTLVPGSVQYKIADDTEWTKLTDAAAYDAATRTIKFYTNADGTALLSAEKGVNYFRFSVTVDRIGSNNANANNYNKAEFTNVANLEYWAIPGDIEAIESLKSESVTHMTEISLTGDKTGSIATYEGVYADRKNVTVVANGDELTFNISVKNTGTNALTNVVVQDTIPENSTLVAKDGDTFEQKDGVLTWIIPEIKTDETATVSFTVKAAAPDGKAVEIINKAKYAVPADINNVKDSEWIETDSVVYQIISITMTSSVAGGTTAEDAKSVEIGSTITYTITVECVDDIYGLNLSNKIPAGMEYVADSAKVKIGDGAAEAAKITLDSDVIKFNQFDEVKAGKLVVTFDVKVKDTDEYDKGVTFINQADVVVKANKDSDKTVALKSNPISHTTKKTNATDTPKLGLETTNAALVWGLITMVALAGIGVFGYFGFIEPYKKRRK